MKQDWIQTLGGKKLRQRRLTVDAVGSIEDIAHSLAGEFRFTRQTRARYTVAQHVTLGSRLIAPRFAGAFLLHDLSETYNPDISGPEKPFLFVEGDDVDDGWAPLEIAFHVYYAEVGIPGFRSFVSWETLERQHTHTMLAALGHPEIEPLIYSPEVKAMDMAMFYAERAQLCHAAAPDARDIEDGEAAPVTIEPWSCERSADEFLTRYREIFT